MRHGMLGQDVVFYGPMSVWYSFTLRMYIYQNFNCVGSINSMDEIFGNLGVKHARLGHHCNGGKG